jgi:hypothetical protein
MKPSSIIASLRRVSWNLIVWPHILAPADAAIAPHAGPDSIAQMR